MGRFTLFPWSLATETISILKSRNATFATYSDLRLPRLFPEPLGFANYLMEFAISTWISPARGMTVLLHHDADRQPSKTITMMQLERRLGARSSAYFFRRRHEWDDDPEDYKLDVSELQLLEREGFEIGYHLNAYERSAYRLEAAKKLTESDVAWFAQRFMLRTYVPHGGRPGPRGENNYLMPRTGSLKNLVLSYNGRRGQSFRRNQLWTDGAADTRPVPDPREVARRAKDGQRLMFLMHPQYYGVTLRPGWKEMPIARERWWRQLWDVD